MEKRRDVIFGAFSPSLTNKDKEEAWKEVQKDTLSEGFTKYSTKPWSKLRDECWQDLRKATLRKYNNQQTGSGGDWRVVTLNIKGWIY